MHSAYETVSMQDWACREILTPIAHNLMKVWPDAAYDIANGSKRNGGDALLTGHVRLNFSFPHQLRGSSEIKQVQTHRLYDPMIIRLRIQSDDAGRFVKTESRALAAELCGFLMDQS